MRRLATGLFAVVLLAGCAAPRERAPPSSPLPTDRTDWIFHVDGDEGYLAYGTPESDDLRLGLRCVRGRDGLELTQVVPRGSRDEIVLRAGDVQRRYAARSEPEEMSGGEFLTAKAGKSDPVMAAFRAQGRLMSIVGGDMIDVLAPQPGTTAVADFFNWCG